MPSSLDQASANQHRAASNTYNQEGTPKTRSSGSRRGKGRRKYDVEEADQNGVSVTDAIQGEVTSSPLQIPLNHAPQAFAGQTPSSIPSPMLAALGSHSHTKQQAPVYPATDWANHIGQSLPDRMSNGNSVASSPPDAHRQTELSPAFAHASPPTSPSAAYRRPVLPNNGYQSFGEYLGSSPSKARPVSMYSQKSIYPPPPHQPQAHFYGVPDMDFGMPRARSESRPPMDDGLCCMFDTLASAGDEGFKGNTDVLLVGSENGLNVYAVGKSKPSCIGRLHGLRGPVVKAKILPSYSRVDPLRSDRPLVAIVVHGPYQPSPTEGQSRPGTSHSRRSSFGASDSMLQAMQAMGTDESDPENFYQTTVEVFSLKAGKHVATLLRAPKMKLETSQVRPYVHIPPPPASFEIQASGKFIAVGSGTGGEIFIFNNETGQVKDTRVAFKCIGKLWTRVLHRRARSLSVSSDSSDVGGSYGKANTSSHSNFAMFSLNHRWLALVPPLSSTQSTLHANVETIRSAQKVPGFNTHTAPTEPPISCETDVPESEGLFNKVARDVTQELIRGARWVGGQGVHAWNNYWAKPSSQSAPIAQTMVAPQSYSPFPPTHANNGLPTSKSGQPTTVSILDMERLCDIYIKPDKALQPLATFSLPYGCSWVSLAPSGLQLLTVSLKGDVHQIWSLMRMIHGEAGRGIAQMSNSRAPAVREIKRFTRLTVANIVDVVWKEPQGESLAILTERGTVHINDIPMAALQWPPPRRAFRPAAVPSRQIAEDRDMDIAVPAAPIGTALGAAFNLVSGRTQPLLAAVRGRPASVGSSALSSWQSLGFPAGAGAKSGKVVAAGFNKSIGAATGTVNSLRHMGENRLTLPGSPSEVMAGCVRWLGGKNRGHIAVTGGNSILVHTVLKSTNAKAAKRRPSVTAAKAIEFSLPESRSASRRRTPDRCEGSPHTTSLEGFWKSPAVNRQSRRRLSSPHPASYGEIRTNAPYQPFHTDRRVGYFIHTSDNNMEGESNRPWSFGEEIPCTKISAGLVDVEEDHMSGQPRQLENLVQDQGHQLVVTTRRRRDKDPIGNEEAEFFDDDCEVVDYAEDRV